MSEVDVLGGGVADAEGEGGGGEVGVGYEVGLGGECNGCWWWWFCGLVAGCLGRGGYTMYLRE